MSKKKIRKQILELRKNNFKSTNIKYSFLSSILKKSNFFKKKIGAYYPINYEMDCFEIINRLEKKGYEISLPVTKKKNNMDFYKWSFDEPLCIGNMGVPEPYQFKKIYPDVLLVPLVSFDKYNYRLGYGGGFYDRYIEKISKIKKILTIGIAFSFQKVNKLPLKNHDKKLDFILTEKSII